MRNKTDPIYVLLAVARRHPGYSTPEKEEWKGCCSVGPRKGRGIQGQFTDVFNKNEHTQVPLLDRSAPFINDIVISKGGVIIIKLLKGLNPSKTLGPDELQTSPKGASNRVRSGICFSSNQWTLVKSQRNGLLQITAPFLRRVTGHLRAIIARFP